MLGHLGAISLKNLTKCEEVRKGADQGHSLQITCASIFVYKLTYIDILEVSSEIL